MSEERNNQVDAGQTSATLEGRVPIREVEHLLDWVEAMLTGQASRASLEPSGPVPDIEAMLDRIQKLRGRSGPGDQPVDLVLNFLAYMVTSSALAKHVGGPPLSARPTSATSSTSPASSTTASSAARKSGNLGINLIPKAGPGNGTRTQDQGSKNIPIPLAPGAVKTRETPSWWPDERHIRKWMTCFKSRLAVELYISHLYEPGWPEIEDPQVHKFIENARGLEKELTGGGESPQPDPLSAISGTLGISIESAKIVFYLLLSDVGDWELPTRGSSILVATGRLGTPQERMAPFAPGSELVEKSIVRVVRAGRTVFSTTYRLSQDALEGLLGQFTGPKFFDRVPGGDRVQLGELREPRVLLDEVILPDSTRDQLMDALVLADPRARQMTGSPEMASLFYKARGTIFLFEGPPGTGKTMAAEGIARHLGQNLYIGRYDRIIDMWMGELEKNVSRLFGEAEEAGAILLLDEADALLASRGSSFHSADKSRNTAVNLILGLLEEFDGIVILTTNLAAKLDAAVERRITARVRFDLPGAAEREKIWRSHLSAGVEVVGDLDLKWLGKRFVLTGARIRSAVLTAFRKALRRSLGIGVKSTASVSGTTLAIRSDDLIEAAREQARTSFRDREPATGADEAVDVGELVHPAFGLERVILPANIRRLVDEILVTLNPKARALFESESFLEKFQTGRGVNLLFDGPSGTGKSMTAQAIAGELGRPLYSVRLDRLISMWVGQSEKGLKRAFDEAQAHDAILLIDEADSLLTGRTIASSGADRLGNNLINLLLNLLEEWTGVVVFTTNQITELDKALERRLTARLTFEVPDLEARLEILERHIPDEVTMDPGVDLRSLARRYPVSGGRIRQAVLGSVRRMIASDPAARTLTQENLEEAFREAQSAGTKRVGFRMDPPSPQPVS